LKRLFQAGAAAAAIANLAPAQAQSDGMQLAGPESGKDEAGQDDVEIVLTSEEVEWESALKPVMRAPAGAAGQFCPVEAMLGAQWVSQCLGATSSATREAGSGAWRFRVPRAGLEANIRRVNQALYAQGYVNSGLLRGEPTDSPVRLQMVVGRFESAEGRCAIDRSRLQKSRRLGSYAEKRLLEGCSKDRAFNAYLLERNFRRLADDRDQWVKHVNMELAAMPGAPGRATLEPVDDAQLLESRQGFDAYAGTANNRTPSIGSLRSFAGLSIRRPFPGVALDVEGGLTAGAVDANGTLGISLSPKISLRVRGDYNEAEIVDPLLRALDIRSRGYGGEAGLSYGALRCPLTPLFGDPLEGVPRRAFDTGLLGCRLAGRMPGDAPLAWAPAKDLAVGLTLSHRESRSYLLGIPFSFAPGAVDGRSYTTSLRASADWLERGRADKAGQRGWTLAARAEATFGLAGSRTDIAGVAAPSPSFFLVRGRLSYARQLPWTNTILTLRLDGQWTSGLLYTAERLPIGGVNSVRGFADATLLVDRGATGTIELGRDFSIAGARGGAAGLLNFRIWGFGDAAYAENLNAATRSRDWLASVGLGLAWKPHPAIEARFERGWRLTEQLALPGKSLASRGYHFGVTVQPLRFLKGGNR